MSKSWAFTFPSNRASALENPIGYRPLSDKVLSDEVSLAAAQARALSGGGGDVSADARRNAKRMAAAIEEKAWSLSWSPIKSLGMNLVMLYFGGASSGIFTVLIISYAMLTAVKTLISVNDIFQNLEDAIESKRDESSPTNPRGSKLDIDEEKTERHPLARFFFSPFLLQKVVFVIICAAISGYIGYHAASMGIIPLRSGDYLGLIPERKVLDRSMGIL